MLGFKKYIFEAVVHFLGATYILVFQLVVGEINMFGKDV